MAGRAARPRKPTVPKSVIGHRGIAARSLKKPQLESYAERLIEGTHEIPQREVDRFLSQEYVVEVHSSNVLSLQYFGKTHQMIVIYKGKGGKPNQAYLYNNISWGEALAFMQAQSKGGASWDILRIRGTKLGHKKPYTKI